MSITNNTFTYNNEIKKWIVTFPSGRLIHISEPLLGERSYKTILIEYEFSTCPGITTWKKEHEHDVSQEDITLEELEKMFFEDCDKYGTENVYQDVWENSMYIVCCMDGVNYTPNLPNWNQIIVDKEVEDERNL